MPDTRARNMNPDNLRELNVLMRISQGILANLDYDKVLQIISNGMAELFELESAAIYMLHNDQDLLLSAATPPLDPNLPDFFRKAKLNEHIHIQTAIQTRDYFLVENTQKAVLSAEERIIVEQLQLKSLLYCPFVQKERVLGVLILGTCQKASGFSKQQIELAQTVANQLSVAIYNVLLLDDLKKHKEHLELLVKEKTRNLDEAIVNLSQANKDLLEKNEIIHHQNQELNATLQNLKETQLLLVQSEKMASLGTLTAGVAHEINNPLNFIAGACQGLEQHLAKPEQLNFDNLSTFLKSIQTGVERISGIVKGLNQFTRQTNNLNETCNIDAILDNCLMLLSSQINHHIKVIKSFGKEPIVTKGNVGQLNQAFVNILLNAVQSIEGEGEVTVRTELLKNNTFQVTVSDTGTGIRKEDLPKITDPFFTTKDPGKGTGLGLSITDRIIRDHGGLLHFESEPGNGTTVKIVLPFKAEDL